MEEQTLTLTYHGQTYEQAKWVVEYFGTPEKREEYKFNKSYREWIEASEMVVAQEEEV